MSDPTGVVTEVLGLLEPMVAADGGSLRMAEFAPDRGLLVVDYDKGVNDACATCVLDADSLGAFIDEGLRARGLHLDTVTVTEKA
jgi:Fe-S cluster biogenesis protein NfuA